LEIRFSTKSNTQFDYEAGHFKLLVFAAASNVYTIAGAQNNDQFQSKHLIHKAKSSARRQVIQAVLINSLSFIE